MKRSLFTLTVSCILFAVVICVLAIWEVIDTDMAIKSIATVGVILIGAMAYSAAHEQLLKKTGSGDESGWRKNTHE
ncbi:MAG: hypothetical protein V3W04_04325 [Gammaproteobacteria bacterium]